MARMNRLYGVTLAERGVSTFIANMPGHADKLGTLHRLSALMGRS